ncbi:MAG TPA: alpha-amylase family glycosyl hydrolase [Gaiellaceae bacterium]|nr:alpha-amylase family glycosyl hydrolase [Gaiellaceae bacterium]
MTDFRALYRLQLGPGLSFADARRLVPYLRELGVSHLYLSPSLQARPGSAHGYDVVDPTRVSEDLGGEEELRALCREAPGVVLDVVPNHMLADEANPFWADEELRARFFDVDPETGAHRRFFTVDELAGVKVEDPEVFEATHRKVLQLAREGVIDGVRVDHPDGLANPRKYLERLRAEGLEHVWVEKILEPGEKLRDWPVEGTTGYEFLNDVAGLFVDPAAEEVLTSLYREVSGESRPFAEVAAEAKLEQARSDFRPEVERLRGLLNEPGLEEALASFRVYRTYVEPERGRVEEADREEVERAGLGERLARVLLLEEAGHEEFVTRFQQTTGAVMAKGVEDTAFYRYNRLLALNDVGGDPGRFGLSLDEFHAAQARRPPNGLLTTFTHDSKRSGDVRARLAALTWIPDEWATLVARLGVEGDDEYHVLQTVVGAWPLEPERLDAYVEKALREGKRTSSWAEPDERAERRVRDYGRSLLEHPEVERFVERVRPLGRRIALGQLLLKLTSPGVPDLYQGDELEVLALVDPDNRRPVDWERSRRALGDGSDPKLVLTRRALELRARRPGAFAGGYEPLELGPDVCAFTRGGEVLIVVPLRDVELPDPGPGWREVAPGLYER